MNFFVGGIIGSVILALIAGFVIVGSPTDQRTRRFDALRVSHLQMIQGELLRSWQSKGALPDDLTTLKDDISGFRVPTDPETGGKYEYHKASPTAFQVCAVFHTVDTSQSQVFYGDSAVPVPMRKLPMGDPMARDWNHGKGRTCFGRTIDPDLYRPQPQPITVPKQ